MIDDAELLRQYARERSEAAFAELVRRHIDLVYSAAVRRLGGDAHRADEVTQDVFLSMGRRAEALSRHPVLAAWLHASSRNAALNLLRSEHRRELHEQQAMNESEASSAPPEWRQLRAVLDETVDELSEQDRRAVILRFFEGRSYAELGAALALREDAARMRVGRAMEKLRDGLARRGITSSAAALPAALTGRVVLSAPQELTASVTRAVLTAAPKAAARLSGLIHLMTMTKTILTFGGAALLVLVGAGLRNQTRTNHVRSEVADANRSLATADTHLEELRRQARSDATAARAKKAARPIPATGDAGASFTDAKASAQELMASHPEIREAWEKSALAAAATGAHNLLRASSVSLTADQEDQLERAMLGRMANSYLQVYTFNGKPYIFGIDGDKVAAQRTIVSLLGGEQQYQELERTQDSRNIASDLAAAGLAESVPLSGNQVRQVAQIIAGNSTSYRQGRAVDPGSIDWDGVAAQAQSVLTPAQLAVLSKQRQTIQYNVALRAATTAPQE